jgi:CO dehydrogenase/acetyl-CoA synthase beta subunit
VNINDHLARIIVFFEDKKTSSQPLSVYEINDSLTNYFKNCEISVEIDKNKGIVLKEELGIELGGMSNTSFSLIYPTNKKLDDDRDLVFVLGNEIQQINTKAINFGIFILIQSDQLDDSLFTQLRHFSSISNDIEGFSIRSIPRRFWSRISDEAIKKGFSFEFFGKAIIHSYKKRYEGFINSMKVFMINSDKQIITEFLTCVSTMKAEMNQRWKKKIEDWKKRIDCDYQWACEICPYISACQNIQEILERRKKIEK